MRKCAMLLKRRREAHTFGKWSQGPLMAFLCRYGNRSFPSGIHTHLKSCNSNDAKQHDLSDSSAPLRSC